MSDVANNGFSNLQPFIADADGGKDNVLYLKGFAGKEEIEAFISALIKEGIVHPPKLRVIEPC